MYLAWIDDEDPEDGVMWNAPTSEDAADMHMDERVIRDWHEMNHPKYVRVHVADYDCDEDMIENAESFEYDIELEPSRSMGRRVTEATA